MTPEIDAYVASLSTDEALAGMEAVQSEAVVLLNTINAMTFEIGRLGLAVMLDQADADEAGEKSADLAQMVRQYREELRVHEEAYWRLYSAWCGLLITK